MSPQPLATRNVYVDRLSLLREEKPPNDKGSQHVGFCTVIIGPVHIQGVGIYRHRSGMFDLSMPRTDRNDRDNLAVVIRDEMIRSEALDAVAVAYAQAIDRRDRRFASDAE